MKKIYLIIPVLFLSLLCFSQNDCGTHPTQSQIDYLNQTRNARQNWNNSESIINLPVQHHIIRESNGTGGLDTSYIQQIIDTLNSYYINGGIQFYNCGPVNIIDNSKYKIV